MHLAHHHMDRMRVAEAISIACDELETVVSYHALSVVLVQFLSVV
jgi:hypothetical protein